MKSETNNLLKVMLALFALKSAALHASSIAGVTGEFRFEIESAECGEIDPWAVGDACVFKLKSSSGEHVGLLADFDAVMNKYSHEQMEQFAGQDIGVSGTDLKPLTNQEQLAVLNAAEEGRTYYSLIVPNLALINDPSAPAINFAEVPVAIGAASENGQYKGYSELESFEHFPDLGDAELLNLLVAGKAARELSVTQMLQIKIARKLIIAKGGPYGEALAAGEYLNDPETRWEVVEMTDPSNESPIDVVRFNERDDGNYSVMFQAGTTKPLYVYYEN